MTCHRFGQRRPGAAVFPQIQPTDDRDRSRTTKAVTGHRTPKSVNEVAAIILAAGRSQRMGAFKPLLPFGPNTVVESCIEHLRGGGAEAVVVVIGQDARAATLRDRLQNSGVTIAVNPDPDSEMSASIAAGVRELPESSRAVLINPVDHAAVPAEVVRLLIAEWQKGAQLVMPSWNERGGHPVLIDLGFRNDLLHLDPARGLKEFFAVHKKQVTRVAVTSNLIARDMDTWDDYCALHLELFGVPPPELPASERA